MGSSFQMHCPFSPPQDFVAMGTSESFLGNQRLKTQYYVGSASKWIQASEGEITGYHQMRMAHQKYANDTLTEVALKGHGHGKATVWYRMLDGIWKFAGLDPGDRWGEFNYDTIFQSA
ncbi:Scytalone dehydratase [Xylariales sp. AK1849]|nr:Scytalone dehydratase [Xylariales sp. AK1849]